MEHDSLKQYIFINNTELYRFELRINNIIAYVNYIIDGNNLMIVNTHIPREFHALNGFGELLFNKIKKFSKSNSILLSSNCPYANALMRKV